ncbi:hypothetical protein IE81DRAFT_331002 [Ceraceosorus guamensis]|uniref:Uncharacterized protein n=1 Tax=Ceraceosorus guamensis TaxID=1522189 RepID=A0A316VUN3_9BASI|nr:hypothetical protein IE81DRAFT_331002 [Ceraceosorus guamensis]PWN41297.1 hypothetical protein IE81DRAFT_331002 [Ceraceosorus guamensis]
MSIINYPAQVDFDSEKWSLLGAAELRDASADLINLTAKGSSDWWRTPKGSQPLDNVNARTGPTLTLAVDDGEANWTAGVWMQCGMDESMGKGATDERQLKPAPRRLARFKQAALFVHAGETIGEPSTSWTKAGVEFDEGRENVGCVVANPYSDWSTAPSKPSVGLSKQNWLYVQVTRHGPDLSVSIAYSEAVQQASELPLRPQASELVQIREIRGFVQPATFQDEASCEASGQKWRVGVMTCGPLSQATQSTFAKFSFESSSSSTRCDVRLACDDNGDQERIEDRTEEHSDVTQPNLSECPYPRSEAMVNAAPSAIAASGQSASSGASKRHHRLKAFNAAKLAGLHNLPTMACGLNHKDYM